MNSEIYKFTLLSGKHFIQETWVQKNPTLEEEIILALKLIEELIIARAREKRLGPHDIKKIEVVQEERYIKVYFLVGFEIFNFKTRTIPVAEVTKLEQLLTSEIQAIRKAAKGISDEFRNL